MDTFNKNGGLSIISEDMSSLLQSIGTPRHVKKSTFLFQEGEKAVDLLLIKSGVFQVSKLNLEGKELTMGIYKRGDCIGELTLFSDDATHMLSSYALEDGEDLIIQRDHLEKALMNNAPLTFEFMKWISTQLRKNQSKIRDLVMHGKKGALYSTLIRISNSYGVKADHGILLDIHLTNQELASFVHRHGRVSTAF